MSPQLRLHLHGRTGLAFLRQFAALTQAQKELFRAKMDVPQNRRNASVILDLRHS